MSVGNLLEVMELMQSMFSFGTLTADLCGAMAAKGSKVVLSRLAGFIIGTIRCNEFTEVNTIFLTNTSGIFLTSPTL